MPVSPNQACMPIHIFFSTFILAISLFALTNYSLEPINAQNSTTAANLQLYQNPTLGFSLSHPPDWEGEESTEGVVEFIRPDTTSPTFSVSVEEVSPYLDTDTLTLKNTTLQQSVQKHLAFLSQFSPNAGEKYKLIRQNVFPVGGNIGWKIEYLSGMYYWFEVFTIDKGKLYKLVYNELPLKVPETIELANKVVDTFQLNQPNKSPAD